MATLNNFGFSVRKRCLEIQSDPETKPVRATPAQHNKPAKQAKKSSSQRNTITRYLCQPSPSTIQTKNDIAAILEETDEPANLDPCILRRHIPFEEIWQQILHHYSFSPALITTHNTELQRMPSRRGQRGRYNDNNENVQKKIRFINDDLAKAFANHVSLRRPLAMPRIQVLDEEEDKEDRSRVVRRSMTIEESRLLLQRIANEFLFGC
ncbi:hypothetical protein DFQ28_000710 [Apophysomyces sp. BC1034]|nr:hypothetical protein DFQ28_000710 [Apophysomyces sp. BC1034]